MLVGAAVLLQLARIGSESSWSLPRFWAGMLRVKADAVSFVSLF
jgi:hypothetical protein